MVVSESSPEGSRLSKSGLGYGLRVCVYVKICTLGQKKMAHSVLSCVTHRLEIRERVDCCERILGILGMDVCTYA